MSKPLTAEELVGLYAAHRLLCAYMNELTEEAETIPKDQALRIEEITMRMEALVAFGWRLVDLSQQSADAILANAGRMNGAEEII